LDTTRAIELEFVVTLVVNEPIEELNEEDAAV
jgi:hypothetical protein